MFLFPAFGFVGDDYKEFACKVTVSGAPVAEFPMVLCEVRNSTDVTGGRYIWKLHNGTQIVRFNVKTLKPTGDWTGYFSHIKIEVPGVAIPSDQFASSGWANAEIKFDWIAHNE